MKSRRAPSSRQTAPSAFTLLEMIVVLIILSVMAALIVPRLTSNDRRTFRLAVDRVADLLMMYAQRENLGQKVVGLEHDVESNRLMLVVLDVSNAAPGAPADWQLDQYVAPVQFPRFMEPTDIEVLADGDLVDISAYPLSNMLGQDRPRIEIFLAGAGQASTLVLAPHAVAPYEIPAPPGTMGPGARDRVDLDQGGQSREDW